MDNMSSFSVSDDYMELPPVENMAGFSGSDDHMELRPGFQFNPTDEELITHYLYPKFVDSSFCAKHIAEVDLNRFQPWDLPWRARMSEKELYYFCVRDHRKNTTEFRSTGAGYWKATGKYKEICMVKTLVGVKMTLVYYKRRSAGGEKTNCVIHEYRLEGKNSTHSLPEMAKSEWVICKVFWKSSGGMKIHKHVENGTFVESINRDDITKCFGKSLDEAAKEFGVSRSTFKRACRRHGIRRWQPKKRKKANEHARGVSQQGEEHPQEGMHTVDPKDQRSNLDMVNAMASSSMSTQGITTQDNTRLWVKVEYNNDIVKFVLGLATVDSLKKEILKRCKLEAETQKIRYKDGDDEMVTIACDEDLHYCLEFFKSTGKAPVRLSLSKESISSVAH